MPSLGPGVRVGSYEIVSAIGAGGMGEVYRARDTKLGRDVAIKVLPAALTTDPDRLARFSREAQVLASLNHPNIAAIHHVEETVDGPAIVLELVEGETLADRIARGAIPVDEALPIAKQIAEALEAAHEQGIIHRDLKPANIKVTPSGTVKVLDFGLAKLNDSTVSTDANVRNALSMSPTITSPMMTGVGVLLGTAAYMAPEQAKGRPADKRSDIWAFGCVLFEMLSSLRAFRGEDVSDTIAEVLRAEPDWRALPGSTPARIRRLLERCFAKDPRLRLRDIGEARIVLDRASTAEANDASAAPPVRRNVAVIVALAVAGAFVGGFITARTTNPVATDASAAPITFSFFPPEHAIFSPNGFNRFSVSGDGRSIAFVADSGGRTSLWLQSLDSPTPRELPGTDGAQGSPFWSPDSRSVAFMADRKVKRIDTNGGALSTICDLPANTRVRLAVLSNDRGTWNRDDVIIFPAGNSLYRVSAKGGEPQVIASSPDARETHTAPTFLADGTHFVFAIAGPTVRLGIWLASLDGAPPERIIPGATHPTWSPPYLLFVRNDVVMAQRIDASSNRPTGEPQVVAGAAGFDSATANFSASPTGVLVYSTGLTPERQFEWVDRTGRLVGKVGEPARWRNFDLSPDGKRLAVGLDQSRDSSQIWLFDLVRGVHTQLTFSKGTNGSPVWSPDGRQVAFVRRSAGGGPYDLIVADTSSGSETILVSKIGGPLDGWSPDGRYITLNDDPTLKAVPTDGTTHTPFAFVQTADAGFDESHFAPDGAWIAYNSNASGTWQVYVARFPKGDERVQISPNGGAEVRWRRDGKELYYLTLDGEMMAVDVELGLTIKLGTPHTLFASSIAVNPRADQYAVSRDGQRFLLGRQTSEGSRLPLTVVVNWPGLMKQ